MTEEELKIEAKKKGYRLIKTPRYTCTCYMPYPNECHRKKNGKWKCLEYEPLKFKRTGEHYPMTRCRKRVE